MGYEASRKNAETHGIVTLHHAIRKRTHRGASFIDLRTHSGQNAIAVQARLIDDLGGQDRISTAQQVMVELVGRDLYMLDETDQRIMKYWRAQNPGPKAIARLYSYRQPIVTNIAKHLLALGLERKPAPVKTLDEIIAEMADEQARQQAEEKPKESNNISM